MKTEKIVTALLDRVSDEARDAGRLERERDIAYLGISEKDAEIYRLRTASGGATPDNIEELIALVTQGKKVSAIKQVRHITDMNLKDAKDLVERARPDWGSVLGEPL